MSASGERPEAPGDGPDATPSAHVRPRHWLSWVWLAPAIAAGIVLWLAIRAIEARGPTITVSFNSAEGLVPGETKVRYKGVDVGTVEAVQLERDISRVAVLARMDRNIAPYLADGARFWIVEPRVGAQGITGLTTLVSGTYIEMYPGRGPRESHFVGLETPPLLQPDTPGRQFKLLAPSLPSLSPGAPLNYRGLTVGQVQGYGLAASREQVEIFVFLRAPYDRLVHTQTRFWLGGGVELAGGAQGLQLRVSSWQELIAGGIEFDTPAAALDDPPAQAQQQFRLYDDRSSALALPRGPALAYRLRFANGAARVEAGTPVQLAGTAIGAVTRAQLIYDAQRQALYSDVEVALDPSLLGIAGAASSAADRHAADVRAGLESMVRRGLRARVVSASFITGQKLIALDFEPGAARREVGHEAALPELPTAPATDIDQVLQRLTSTLQHIDEATAGPELGHALKSLDETLTRLDQATGTLEPQLVSLVGSLRDAAAAAQRTADAAGSMLGTSARGNIDLPGLMRQLNDAARSIRELAEYLDRHPESLLRGRKGD